jgi:hypothetical protein
VCGQIGSCRACHGEPEGKAGAAWCCVFDAVSVRVRCSAGVRVYCPEHGARFGHAGWHSHDVVARE